MAVKLENYQPNLAPRDKEGAKRVVLDLERFRTRVRLPPPPPFFNWSFLIMKGPRDFEIMDSGVDDLFDDPYVDDEDESEEEEEQEEELDDEFDGYTDEL